MTELPPGRMPQRPWQVGVVQGRERYEEGVVAEHLLRIVRAGDLVSLSRDYGLFTLGLFEAIRGHLGKTDLLDRYAQEHNRDVVPIGLCFDRPLFEGFEKFGESRWNARLQGLPLEDFADFARWLGSVSFLDRPRKTLYRLRPGQVAVTDDSGSIEVLVACIDSSVGCAYVAPGDPPGLPHPVLSNRPDPETLKLLDALLTEHSAPFG